MVVTDLSDSRGAALVIALVMLVILSLMGITAVLTSGTGIFIAGNQRVGNQTFYIADAALDRAIADHLYELASSTTSPSPDWSDTTLVTPAPGGNVSLSATCTSACGLAARIVTRPDETAWLNSSRIVLYPDADASGWVTFAPGRYQVRVLQVSGQTKEIYIRARGEQTVGGVTLAKVQVMHLRVENANAWSSAIFSGSGSSSTIQGNVKIHGSVHILGDGATPSTKVLDLNGNAGIYNNYGGMPTAFSNRVPSQTTLDAKLRAKIGYVDIGGSGTIGESLICSTPKCKMDRVYVTNGINNADASNTFSDNGYPNAYDLGDKIKMPSLKKSAASAGFDAGTPTVEQDFNFGTSSLVSALIIGVGSPPGVAGAPGTLLASICDINSGSGSFRVVDNSMGNLISWNQASLTLLVSGKISLESVTCPDYNDNVGTPPERDGNKPTMIIGKNNEIVSISGRGTIFTGTDINHGGIYPNILVRGDGLVTLDSSTSTYRKDFPFDHALGLMTGRQLMVYMNGSGKPVMGAFYAEWRVKTDAQTNVAGSTLSSTFIVNQTPEFYQVPDLSDNVPPGMPAGNSLWAFTTREWWEVQAPQL